MNCIDRKWPRWELPPLCPGAKRWRMQLENLFERREELQENDFGLSESSNGRPASESLRKNLEGKRKHIFVFLSFKGWIYDLKIRFCSTKWRNWVSNLVETDPKTEEHADWATVEREDSEIRITPADPKSGGLKRALQRGLKGTCHRSPRLISCWLHQQTSSLWAPEALCYQRH